MIHHDTFAGVYPAMTTPFTDGTDAVDHEQLAADARRLADAGVDGLVPVGSTGEAATLTHDEHAEVVETVVDAVDVPVIAGTGSNSTREALDLTERAADAGADAALLISPYYNKPVPAGQYEHYATIADAVDIPQIVYNVPSRTGSNLDVDTIVDLAGHENIQGYKAASGDANQISEIIERTREETFDVLSGDDGMTLPVMSMGATGTISVVANVEPERTSRLVHAALEEDFETARAIHHDLGPLTRALFRETNPIPVKEAMAIRGYGPAEMRPPLTRGSDETLRVLTELLAELEDADATATEA
ncbi:4-hydroxy-tetrahydrodipicolinate synthase [Halobaculum marinum]|uniref:4-hydroxy-tetrahydrodipicolinate synthase n=1 Tax=Halobaculum marinum TaxID=3031996 RepID=A0ABD5X1P9_9EURY|nr:4-hydroxy-tetrahydrodipicolinate synthase [Halobaculum sp. DT55]